MHGRDQEGRRGPEEAVPGPSVFPSGEPGVSGDFWVGNWAFFSYWQSVADGREGPEVLREPCRRAWLLRGPELGSLPASPSSLWM